MRIQNEQWGSSSLFAQPMALEAVPEEAGNREQGIGNREQGIGNRAADAVEPEATVEATSRDAARAGVATGGTRRAARTMLEARKEAVLGELAQQSGPPTATTRQGHLALLKRWYYRPEAKRTGEICFPDGEGQWPVRALLRAVGRVAAKSLTAAAPS